MTPRRSALTVLVGATGLLALMVGSALAYWTSTGLGSGSATVATLGAPTAAAVVPVDQTTDSLRITWTNSTGTPAPLSYSVTDTSGTPRTLACSATPCVDSGLAAGSTHTYQVKALRNAAWTADAATAPSGTTNTKSTLAITSPAAGATGVSKTATVTGTTAGGTAPGTITVTVKKTSDSSTVQTATPTPSAGSWSFALAGLADSTQYTISAMQASAGGPAAATAISFTTAAASATITLTGCTDDGSNNKSTCSGTYTGSVTPITISWVKSGQTTVTRQQAVSGGTFSITSQNALPATGTWTATATGGTATSNSVSAVIS